MPLTGKPPKPRISGIAASCSSGSAPPPAPTNRKRVRTVRSSPLTVSRTVRPAAVVPPLDVGDPLVDVHVHAAVLGGVEQQPGQRPEVDVGACGRAGGGDPPGRR